MSCIFVCCVHCSGRLPSPCQSGGAAAHPLIQKLQKNWQVIVMENITLVCECIGVYYIDLCHTVQVRLMLSENVCDKRSDHS